MRAVVQRVSEASVTVSDAVVGSIDRGLLVYLGVAMDDTDADLQYMTRKISQLRLFTDDQGKMNLSVKQIHGKLLVVSQFTLCADLQKGNRPSFNPAAPPRKAEALYDQFVRNLRDEGFTVETGAFGAIMQVRYVNEGPVTIVVDSPDRMKQNDV